MVGADHSRCEGRPRNGRAPAYERGFRRLYILVLSVNADRERHTRCRPTWLPNDDEYLVGYKDRSAIFDTAHILKLDPRANILFHHTIVIIGQIAGIWRRTQKKNSVVIEASLFVPLNDTEIHALESAVERYGTFTGQRATLRIQYP